MKLSPYASPAEPQGLLIRFHNQMGAAVDITGTRSRSSWYCHGCAYRSTMIEGVTITRQAANDHATHCRASHQYLG
ncbi:hypothetical protein ABT084_04275 [Streptomyces sp. NPDC002138]|uniref:hypothetical protein n=1 Tax=Streptomyces sp. NPDC002138 TaxID=3154410 RepID=UPI00331AE678